MKIIIIILLLLPFAGFGQEKRDEKITVIASDTTNLFNRVALLLYEKGYTFEQKDEQLKFIATTDKPIPKAVGSCKLRVLVKDSAITLYALVAVDPRLVRGGDLQKVYSPAQYRGMKGSLFMVVWAEMESIARKFGNQIIYSK